MSDASSYAVTVYRQDALEQGTLQPVWTSYDPAKGLFEQDIKHPREVYVDAANGKAFVTGMGGFWVIDTVTFEVQKVDPAPGVLSHPMTIWLGLRPAISLVSQNSGTLALKDVPDFGEAVDDAAGERR